MSSIKIKRINASLIKAISEVLMNKSRDEFLKSVTITDVDTANDLSYAKVYFTSLQNLNHDIQEKEMNEASSFIRYEVSQIIDLRQMPKLKFIYDESISYGTKIEKKLQEINERKS